MAAIVRHLAGALVLVAMLGTNLAAAHVPHKCRQLYLDAGKESAWVTRKGKQVSDLSMDGLGVLVRASRGRLVDQYMNLADQVAQLLGGQTALFEALAKAIQCTDGRAQ